MHFSNTLHTPIETNHLYVIDIVLNQLVQFN